MNRKYILSILIFCISISTISFADSSTANAFDNDRISVTINMIDEQGLGQEIGTIKAKNSKYGLLLTPDLADVPPGIHGFHVHENPSCEPGEKDGKITAGVAAGGHYDPQATDRHQGPYAEGHLGDLPPLVADDQGNATLPILAPRLKTSDLKGLSLMIHAGGDNFADTPKKLGGGGARLACGAID